MAIFTYPDSHYTRNINPIGDYVDQMSVHVSRSKRISLYEARAKITELIKTKGFKHIRNPKVTFKERQPNGDMELRETSLSNHIDSHIKSHRIIAPTMTTYVTKEVAGEALLVTYTKANIKKRSAAKKLAFKLEAEAKLQTSLGNHVEATLKRIEGLFKAIEQAAFKVKNNAVSGMFAKRSSPLFNRSAHSTLTSNCRVFASIANANNEKIIAGNRHYWSHQIAINNIISTIQNLNTQEIDETIKRYGLIYPTVEDTLKCIKYSTSLYWNDPKRFKKIVDVVSYLSPTERAAFVYIGDLYHLRTLNSDAMFNFFLKLSRRVTGELEDPLSQVHNVDEDILNLTHQICSNLVEDMGKNYEKMHEKGILTTIVLTAQNIEQTLKEYEPFIKTFFVTKNIPSSVAHIPDSLRRSVISSDTDSTIFGVEGWVTWFFKNRPFDFSESEAVAGAAIFMASQSITHALTILSKNLGFSEDNLHVMAMKSEFYWPVFINANVAKHYLAMRKIREGNVYSEMDLEVKGVNLVSSTLPKELNRRARGIMKQITDTVYINDVLSIRSIYDEVVEIENLVRSELRRGSIEYYRIDKVKEENSYKLDRTKSPFQRHVFWEDVFSPTYGSFGKPPYSVIRVPTTLTSRQKIKVWLGNHKDQAFALRFSKWMLDFKKEELPTIYIPMEFSNAYGVPIELHDIIDTERIIHDLCRIFYMLLEMIGYQKKENRTLTGTSSVSEENSD